MALILYVKIANQEAVHIYLHGDSQTAVYHVMMV